MSSIERAYVPLPEDVQEHRNTIVFGEDPLERLGSGADSKPIRALAEFSIFDATHQFELVSLDIFDKEGPAQQNQYEAAGWVSPVFVNEEDAGQEDGLVDNNNDQQQHNGQMRLRTSTILRWTIDYTRFDSPVYVETQYSWFELCRPAKPYVPTWTAFYCAKRVAQLVISAAMEDTIESLNEFEEVYYGRWDHMLQKHIFREDFHKHLPFIKAVLEDYEPDTRHRVMCRPFVDALIKQGPFHMTTNLVHQSTHVHQAPLFTPPASISGNLDLTVLQPQHQYPTHVSPLIGSLALGLFHENLHVVGAPPKHPNRQALRQQQDAMHLSLARLANRCADDKPSMKFPSNGRLDDVYWSHVVIDGVVYMVGDCVIVQDGGYKSRPQAPLPNNLADLPPHAHIADYFWFAKIIYINQQRKECHVRWFEHSSKTFLEELGARQELFLWPTCDTIPVTTIVEKVLVLSSPPEDKDLGPLEYICRFLYNEIDGSFTDISNRAIFIESLSPPDNCMSCHFYEVESQEKTCQVAKNSVSLGGHVYHVDDYALFTDSGAASIGRITHIFASRSSQRSSSPTVQVCCFGRVVDLAESEVHPHFMHEQELFLTQEVIDLPIKDLLKPCFVAHYKDVEDLDFWLSLSPLHFFVRYQLPTLTTSWKECVHLQRTDVPACSLCLDEENAGCETLAQFIQNGQSCLRTFDPFGGVGAFGLAMEAVGCIQLTHAVEITPSAALTLKENSPQTTVYNQCSNLVYQYAVKSFAGKLNHKDIPVNLQDNSSLPLPPTPNMIDCIVAGFPCQPHSQLNMFQKANDRKSHLMLNLLSWVDFLQPKYCLFENVRGFLSYNLHAHQAGRYRVEGGIKMGGLKFLVQALLTMGYQVRFGLLQAANYGTPQARVRFFLVASKEKHPLPNLPQPTHSFELKETLEIKLPNCCPPIQPILTKEGTAPLKFVSIEAAINDLPDFHWKDPHKLIEPPPNPTPLQDTTPQFECTSKRSFCGFSGPCPSESLSYRWEKPKTSYQARCRKGPSTKDLQHFTRIFPLETVERVVNVPLTAGADYRDFPPSLLEWQNAHPTSAVARDGFRPGMYGRLDQKKWFHTTVTNIEPTAKQSYIVHPWCKRVLTIRELARSQGFPDWFVFHSVDGNVKTMQRHIGNAVPWPVSEALGKELREAMLKKFLQDRENATEIN
ncbi:S-adenosyl-L-methionine-dependent methyltransferase [Trametes meyenii]|nr:S-adenosyl-L-methionine-dependent methyltransferase [Trametes meyenii]